MNILFTGASSCTGMHFVQDLALRGHQLTCVFTRSMKEYHGIRKERILRILPYVKAIWNTKFGGRSFCTLIQENNFDTYAHHMAWTKGYGTENYDIQKALRNNTNHLSKVIDLLQKNGCVQVILTNSVFEGLDIICEGGDAPFESHGTAKKETTKAFLAFTSKLPIRRFIIPNPIGIYDNTRLVEYLHTSWQKGETPHIRYPENIRDNIPIPALRKQYTKFIEGTELKTAPSGWVQNNQSFVQMVALELQKRFSYTTPCIFGPQTDYHQPIRLHNTDPILPMQRESEFWDNLCTHYAKRFGND